MPWAQVLDDFIKIGLPSLCTAVVAFLIAKFTRSHDFEKERRRRKQDFLERAAEPPSDDVGYMREAWSGGSKVFKEPLGAATAGAVARDFFSMHTHFDLFDDPIPEGWGRKGDPRRNSVASKQNFCSWVFQNASKRSKLTSVAQSN